MNAFHRSLDRYLTSEPDIRFNEYTEAVLDAVPNEIYDSYEDFFEDSQGLCQALLQLYFSEDIPIVEAVKHIVLAAQKPI